MNPTSPESTWPLTSTNQKPLLPRHQNNHLNTILMHHPWYKENIHTPLHSNSWFLAIRQKSFRIFPSNSPTHLDLIWIRCHERNALRKTKNRGVCRAESHRQKNGKRAFLWCCKNSLKRDICLLFDTRRHQSLSESFSFKFKKLGR